MLSHQLIEKKKNFINICVNKNTETSKLYLLVWSISVLIKVLKRLAVWSDTMNKDIIVFARSSGLKSESPLVAASSKISQSAAITLYGGSKRI